MQAACSFGLLGDDRNSLVHWNRISLHRRSLRLEGGFPCTLHSHQSTVSKSSPKSYMIAVAQLGALDRKAMLAFLKG